MDIWLSAFVKFLVSFFGQFKLNNRQIPNANLLKEFQDFYLDRDYLSNQIQSQINAQIYGKGRIVPSEYIGLARSSKNPELLLTMHPYIWNFLKFPGSGGVVIRGDLDSLYKRKHFRKIVYRLFFTSMVAIIFTAASVLTKLEPVLVAMLTEARPNFNYSVIFNIGGWVFWLTLSGVLFVACLMLIRKLEFLDEFIFSSPVAFVDITEPAEIKK